MSCLMKCASAKKITPGPSMHYAQAFLKMRDFEFLSFRRTSSPAVRGEEANACEPRTIAAEKTALNIFYTIKTKKLLVHPPWFEACYVILRALPHHERLREASRHAQEKDNHEQPGNMPFYAHDKKQNFKPQKAKHPAVLACQFLNYTAMHYTQALLKIRDFEFLFFRRTSSPAVRGESFCPAHGEERSVSNQNHIGRPNRNPNHGAL